MSLVSIEDHLAITELLSRYSHAIDRGAPEEFADLFTADGEWEGPGGTHRGRAQLIELIEAYRRHPDVASSRHWVSSTVIDEEDGKVRATSYSLCAALSEDGQGVIAELIGRYHDELVQVDGEWRFARRLISGVFPIEINDFALEAERS